MRRFLKLAALPAMAVAVFSIVPALAGASSGTATPGLLPPTVDGNTCHSETDPQPASGSIVVPGLPTNPWVHPSGTEAGIKGTNGFLVVKNAVGQSLSVKGKLNAVDLRGEMTVTPNNANNRAALCLSANPQNTGTRRVRVQVP